MNKHLIGYQATPAGPMPAAGPVPAAGAGQGLSQAWLR
jgi:hypothetical protein